jgi:hypothetical protein
MTRSLEMTLAHRQSTQRQRQRLPYEIHLIMTVILAACLLRSCSARKVSRKVYTFEHFHKSIVVWDWTQAGPQEHHPLSYSQFCVRSQLRILGLPSQPLGNPKLWSKMLVSVKEWGNVLEPLMDLTPSTTDTEFVESDESAESEIPIPCSRGRRLEKECRKNAPFR